jgi:hypothetical protein
VTGLIALLAAFRRERDDTDGDATIMMPLAAGRTNDVSHRRRAAQSKSGALGFGTSPPSPFVLQKEVPMKRTMLALAAMVMLTAGSIATANAQEFRIGPGGVYLGPHHRHYYNEYEGNCRVIVTHHTNRFGEDVEVRRRVCD